MQWSYANSVAISMNSHILYIYTLFCLLKAQNKTIGTMVQ